MPDDISGEMSRGCCDTYDGGQDGCGGTQMPPKSKRNSDRTTSTERDQARYLRNKNLAKR